MELAPKRFGHRRSSGTNSLHASKVFALLPTRTLVESLCAASLHMPPSTFLWSGSHLKIAFKATTFPGDQKPPAHSRVQVIAQDPFPGFWVLHHKLLTSLLVLGIRMVLLESVPEAFHHLKVFLIRLRFRLAPDLSVRSAYTPAALPLSQPRVHCS